MRLPIVAAVALFVLGVLGWYGGYAKDVQGELRREGRGAVIINVDGKDYAVNGMAGSRYPPIERIWNSATHPEADTGRIPKSWIDPMRLVGPVGRRDGLQCATLLELLLRRRQSELRRFRLLLRRTLAMALLLGRVS
jgi:hypothetical protein